MLTLPPVKGEIALAGVLPLAGVGGSSRTRVIVVVVVVVEHVIILIIIIVDPFETSPAHFCQTVHLESLFFLNLHFYIVKRWAGIRWTLLFFHFSYALEGRI